MPKLPGVTLDASNAPLAGVTVNVFRASTNAFVGSAVSDASGNYSVSVPDTNADYYALAFKAGSPFVAGTTRRNLVGIADSVPVEEVPPGEGTTVKNLWTGVPTTDGVIVSARMNMTKTANLARLVVSRNADMSSPSKMLVAAPDPTYRIAKLIATGLQPNTEYHYGVEIDGVLDPTTKGRFKTLPPVGAAASFRLALGCCANNSVGSAAGYPAHQAIRELSPKPLAMLFLGDLAYTNNGTALESDKLETYEAALGIATRHQTMREIPWAHTWDDHCYGPDNSCGYNTDGTVKAYRQAALDAARRRWPAPIQSSDPSHTVDYAFVIGRWKIIMSDLRADKWDSYTPASNLSKTMMGAAQKQRWKDHITAAAAAGQYVVWCSSVPWHDPNNNVSTAWGGYNRERVELADHIKACGMSGKVLVIAGDGHSQAYHGGVDYATAGGALTPVFQVGAMHSGYSEKGGPYTVGPVEQTSTSNYGIMDVYDDGTNLTVHWIGKAAADNTTLIDYRFTLAGTDQGVGIIVPPGDGTAPKLTVPSAAATGSTTASGSVTTNEANGTLYRLASINATESAATIKAANLATAVTAAGAQSVSFAALTAATEYRAHFVHVDAANNSSAVSSSAAFTTQAAPVGQTPSFEAAGATLRTVDGFYELDVLAGATLVVNREQDASHLLLGGGGAGSGGGSSSPGGGSAAEPLTGSKRWAPGAYPVVIGDGGTGVAGAHGGNGKSSTVADLVALGGVAGSTSGKVGDTGPSGGGGAATSTGVTLPGNGTPGKGHPGGQGASSATAAQIAGGGGGGANGPGSDAALGKGGDGGPGVNIFGRDICGGGGGCSATTEGFGVAGGGKGSKSSSSPATDGAPNTGAGGGAARSNLKPGNGGTGRFILRWPVTNG